jgi:hypothetical protein
METHTYLNNDYCLVEYLPTLSTVRLQYKRSLQAQEFKHTFGVVLKVFEETKAENYLSDSRKQGVVAMENQKWLETEVIPKAVKNGMKRILTVVPKDVFAKFYVENIKTTAERKSGIEFRYFESLSDGEAWIASTLK